jgi:diguanylate cyclase (GGDEF)-like protein
VEGKVLVVDNAQPVRVQLRELLGQRGFQVEEASSGGEALSKLEGGDYAVVLLDLDLPGMGGMEVLEKVLSLRPDQSIIMMAALGSVEPADALRKGAYDHVTKPIQPAELELSLRRCVERNRLLRVNAFLRQETLRDDLTDAFNRRYLDQYLVEELERARRYERPFSILFFDLDYLKQVNDRYGHLCGSKVLIELVALIKSLLRRSDKIFRFGGDEFVLAMPETDQEGAIQAAHRLRKAIRKHRFEVMEGVVVSLTASFGIATYPDDGATGEALMRHADEAMYLVKSTSRDGVGVKGGR